MTKAKLMLTIFSVSVFCSFNAQDAKEIIRNAYEKVNGVSSYSEMTMEIIRPTWERSVSMKTWSLETEYSMVYITAPAKEKGQVFMKRENEMWNWQPSISKMIKLPPSMMMQSWMGSDFTNDDLINQASIIDDYTHKIIGEENIDNYVSYKIELIPHENAPVVWGKLLTWVSKEGNYMLKTEFYDEDNYLIKTEIASEIKKMGDEKLPTKFTTIPEEEPGNKTILIINNIDFSIQNEKSFFSQQNMKRIR